MSPVIPALAAGISPRPTAAAQQQAAPVEQAVERAAWNLRLRSTPTVAANGVLLEEPSPANVIAAVEAAAGG